MACRLHFHALLAASPKHSRGNISRAAASTRAFLGGGDFLIRSPRHVELNVIAHSAVISNFQHSKRWERALSLLRELPQIGIRPDVISCNSAISVCEKAALLC